MRKAGFASGLVKSILLITVLLAGVVCTGAARDERPSSVNTIEQYVDVTEIWSYEALKTCVKNGFLNGVDDTHLNPNSLISRAEMSAIMTRLANPEDTMSDISFTDVSSDDWYYEVIGSAVSLGLLEGDGTGKVRPNDAITKEEAAVIFHRLFKLDGYSYDLSGFNDYSDISSWACDAVSACVASGVIRPTKNQDLLPHKQLSRAEFAYMLTNLISAVSGSNVNSVEEFNSSSVVVNVPGVEIIDATVNKDLWIMVGASDGEVQLSNVHVPGTVYVLGGSDISFSDSSDVNNLVLYKENCNIVLDDTSTVNTTYIHADGTYLKGSFGKVYVDSKCSLDIEDSVISSLIGSEGSEATIDAYSAIEDYNRWDIIAANKNNLSFQKTEYDFIDIDAVVGKMSLTSYNPIEFRMQYDNDISELITDLCITANDSTGYDIAGAAHEMSFTLENGEVVSAHYIPMRFIVSDIHEEFDVYINGEKQDALPYIDADDAQKINVLLPFSEDFKTVTVRFSPANPNSKFKEVSVLFTLTSDFNLI